MNLKAHYEGFKVFAGAKPDIVRVTTIWQECLATYGGPYLFGDRLTLADAMYAPVCARFSTYDVKLDKVSEAYVKTILHLPLMVEWTNAAKAEPDDVTELDAEF
jgi:glutathione S-transferase